MVINTSSAATGEAMEPFRYGIASSVRGNHRPYTQENEGKEGNTRMKAIIVKSSNSSSSGSNSSGLGRQ